MRIFTECVAAATAFVFAFGLGVNAGAAQGRPDVRNLSCGQAQALVQQHGAIVLTTGRYTYDRFVASRRFCPAGEEGEYAWVQTRDAQSCRIGYVCVMDTDEWDDRFWWRRR